MNLLESCILIFQWNNCKRRRRLIKIRLSLFFKLLNKYFLIFMRHLVYISCWSPYFQSCFQNWKNFKVIFNSRAATRLLQMTQSVILFKQQKVFRLAHIPQPPIFFSYVFHMYSTATLDISLISSFLRQYCYKRHLANINK